MKFTTSALLFLLVLLTAPACKKDKKTTQVSAPSTVLLTREFTDLYNIQYTYDADHKLTSVLKQGQFDGDPSINLALFTITYNLSGKIIEVLREYSSSSMSYGWKDLYFYTDGQISSIAVYQRDGQTNFYNFYQNNLYNHVSDDVVDVVTASQVNPWYRARYKSTGGNTTEYYYYTGVDNDNLIGTLDFAGTYTQFDNKHHYHSSLPAEYNLPYRYASNPGKFQSGNYIETITYEYNSDGYPIKKMSSDGSVIEYEYQKIP